MGETIISATIISALFLGASQLLKVLFGGNKTKKEQYEHEERIIQLMQSSNDNSEKLLNSVEGLRTEVNEIKNEFSGLNERVLKLEEKNSEGLEVK